MTALARSTLHDIEAQDIVAPIPAGFRLRSGDVLSERVVRLRRYGPADAPAVVALGGISADRFVAGDDGWWSDLVGDGRGVNTQRFAVFGLDFAPLGDERVRLAPSDQAALIVSALDHLGIDSLHACVGASYGGMIALALAAQAPERVERLCVLAAAHRPSALGAAWRGVQRRVVEFGAAHGDAAAGLGLARQLAMTTYRSGAEFDARFACALGPNGLSDVDAYLIARGDAYARSMAPQRWLSLSEAIDRFGVDASRIQAATTLVAFSSDQLAPEASIRELAGQLPRAPALHVISSIYGHDGFLKEANALAPIVRAALGDAQP